LGNDAKSRLAPNHYQWYRNYRVRIATVERDYGFPDAPWPGSAQISLAITPSLVTLDRRRGGSLAEAAALR
jgi:hypothetical protein